MREKKRFSSYVFSVIKYVSLILASVVSLVPVCVCVLTAFKTNEEYASTSVLDMPASFAYFENFKIAVQKANVLRGSAYYDAVKDEEALELAVELKCLIEERCTDPLGYLEAFTRDFKPADNEKLSENGVMAEKTMNTLLHVFEAYTELYRVSRDESVADRLRFMMDIMADKIYNRALGRQEVFFDREWNSLIDLYSYGHDIETAWLADRGLEVLGDQEYDRKMSPITKEITKNIYKRAFYNGALMNEAENKVSDRTRVWWVQAEGIVGFVNGYQKNHKDEVYLEAAEKLWEYITRHLIDPREGSEWFWSADEEDRPIHKPIVEPWKCPYHNGRMCVEVIRRLM